MYSDEVRRTLLLIGVLALALASPANAKGPDRATVTGPGLERPLIFSGYHPSALGVLTEQGGFWQQVFGIGNGRIDQGGVLPMRPRGSLGPRYVVVYRLPGPKTSLVRQTLYPFARTPVSHMERQRFWGDRVTRGGWYRWGPDLEAALVRAGLPATRPAQACPVTTSSHSSGRYGSARLWVHLPPAGVLGARRNQPDDGRYGTKVGWIPDRDRGLTLSVSGQRLDAPGKVQVLGVFWGHNSNGRGSWASAISFPEAGCYRLSGRAGPTTVSYVVRVVTDR